MVSESPWSSFVRVSYIIFKYFDTHNAIWTFDGHKIVNKTKVLSVQLGKTLGLTKVPITIGILSA